MTAPAPAAAPPGLLADYFDGLHAQAQPVWLTVQAGLLHVDSATPGGPALALRVPVRQVAWPERQRHGARQADLPGKGMLSHADPAAWDAWARASGVGGHWLVPWMQSWRGALAATLLLLAALWAGWLWGVPAAGQAIVALLPEQADRTVGDAALASLDRDWLRPSAIPAAEQQAWRARLAQAVARADAQPGARPLPAWTLHFRRLPDAARRSAADAGHPGIANALALPGGHLVLSDGLLQLLADRPEVVIGVLGHELGHVQHRHGMRLLVQSGLLAAGSALLVGDVSSLLAAVPVLLGQAAYSRSFELQADAAAARLMRANGIDVLSFAVLFERLRRADAAAGGPGSDPDGSRDGGSGPAGRTGDSPAWHIGLASHPPDAERLRRMAEQR